MVLEEIAFVFEGLADRFRGFDIALTTVNDRYISQAKRDDATSKNVHDVGTLVPTFRVQSVEMDMATKNSHQVNLCQDTNCPRPLRVHFSRHLQTIRVRQIGVSTSDGQDDTRGFRNIFHEHLSDLFFNIPWLVPDGHFRQPGKINQRQCQNIRRVYAKINGLRRNSCITASFGFSIPDDFVSNLVEIVELLARKMEKFAPFIGISSLVVAFVCAVDWSCR